MTYENKPGTGCLFRNERKQKETHPDYRGPFYEKVGDGVVEREISAWEKQSKNGTKYLWFKVGDKFVPNRIGPPLEPPAKEEPPFSDTIPF